jgi:hypothetical protein
VLLAGGGLRIATWGNASPYTGYVQRRRDVLSHVGLGADVMPIKPGEIHADGLKEVIRLAGVGIQKDIIGTAAINHLRPAELRRRLTASQAEDAANQKRAARLRARSGLAATRASPQSTQPRL